jgi:GLPGLI family protein
MNFKFTPLLLVLALMATITPAIAQSGEVIYHEKMDMHKNLPEGKDMIRAMIPQFQESTQSLLFNSEAMLYAPYDGADDQDVRIQHEQDGMDVDIQIERPESRFFYDLKKGTMIQSQEFFGRVFLISDDIPEYGWKLTGERKKIAGYDCVKATWSPPKPEGEHSDEEALEEGKKAGRQGGRRHGPPGGMMRLSEMDAEAWFTTAIPVSGGPMGFGQLPGMILELNLGDGTMVISATEVNLREVDGDELEAPNKGKKVSREEFDEMAREKMEEMRMEMGGRRGEGGGPGIQIITIDEDF